MNRPLICVIWTLGACCSMGQAPKQSLQEQVDMLQKALELVTKKVIELEVQVDSQQTYIRYLTREVERPGEDPVDISIQEGAPFTKIGVPDLSFAVSYRRAEPHLDGIRIWLEIMPLGTFCSTTTNFKLVTGKAKPKQSKDFPAWINDRKETEATVSTPVCPGKWTELSFVVPSYKPQDFGSVAITATVQRLSPSK